MAKTLWDLPVPSGALLDGGPVFEKRVRREVALRMSYEDEANEGARRSLTLVFAGVEAFKVTYDRARADWMLLHLLINFDDGPCYEVICRSHRFED